jgi:N-acetylmuramoyl-L-alanine amidase
LHVRSRFFLFQITFAAILFLLVSVVVRVAGQGGGATLTLVSREGRRALPIVTSGRQEMVSLDELSSIFQLSVREEGGAITVSHQGRTIVLTPDQSMVSVAGRVISLPAPPARVGNRWLVPLDFISRAVAPIHDTRIELRRASHLLLVGDVRVPHVTVRQEQVAAAARITMEVAPRANATVSQDGNDRLTVRFDADGIDPTLPSGEIPGFVRGYRPIELTGLAIDLGPRFAAYRTSTEVLDTSTRLVIDLLPEQADTPGAAPPPPAPTTTELAPPPTELPTFGGGGGWLQTIAIDAGHGGDDVGVTGPGGATEKTVTLAIARRLKAVIEARLGLRVIMTREDDHRVAVTDRTALANNNKADLLVSLHANGSFRPTVSGATVYVATFEDVANDAPPLVPERLPAQGGGFRDLELVPWNLAQMRYKDQSEALAVLLIDQFTGRVPLAGTSVGHAPLRVLESANMPAVLIEVGYLTNPDQEKQLATPEFQGAAAQGIVDAIVKFREVAAQSEGAVQ